MAVTKTHPIKSTMNLAIQYICNPDKTDGKILISSFGCSPETADIEFEWTRRQAIDKGNNLGRHIIQSFSPTDNISPEQAHEIGMKLAEEILGGRYEFVISTQVDYLWGRTSIKNYLVRPMRPVNTISVGVSSILPTNR